MKVLLEESGWAKEAANTRSYRPEDTSRWYQHKRRSFLPLVAI